MYTYMIKQLQFLKDTRIQTIVSSVFLFSITMLLSFYIVFNANWLFGDDTLYLCTTAIGKILPISNDMNFGGRFFPLGHYDFNILVLIGKYSPTAHYILSAISFILFVIITSFFYKKIINNTSQNNKYNIFHNAGVTTEKEGLFYKALYMNKLPYNEDLKIKENTASFHYYQSIQKVEKKSILI